MSTNAQREDSANVLAARAVPPVLPQRAGVPSPEASQFGADLAAYVLAFESFLNRYSVSPFIEQCITGLQKKLSSTAEENPALYSGVKALVGSMPLDTLSQGNHPKKLKQALLESLLNPAALCARMFYTDPNALRELSLDESIRDLQEYIKLCELSSDAVSAREALTQIIRTTARLSEEERAEFRRLSQQFSFKYLTDRGFCLTSPAENEIQPETRTSPEVKKPIARLADDRFDAALEALNLFHLFETLSREPTAAAGETYDSLQRRANEQRSGFVSFTNHCRSIPTERRELMYSHISRQWPRFSRSDRSCIERQARFLDFLANLA